MDAFWESFRLDPRQPGNAPMRASDADREIVRAVLAESYSDGRLTHEEYDDRLNALYSGGRTLGELLSLVTDLVPPEGQPSAPVPPPRADLADLRARGARKWRRDVEASLSTFLIPNIICTVIWIAFSRGDFFWPMFPMLFLGLNLVSTVVRRESIIDHEIRRMEKRAARDALQQEKRAAKEALRSAQADRGDPDEAPEG